MRRGIVSLPVGEHATAAAPPSGVQLGVGEHGRPLTLRLFRQPGTRIVLAARELPAQLLALRAAAAGTPVQVLTGRPQLWAPLLPRDAGHVVAEHEIDNHTGGPALVIDDRRADARDGSEVRPWQCRVDVRTRWSMQALSAYAHADLTIFGAVPPELTRPVARAFGLPTGAVEGLARLDATSVAALRRGVVQFAGLNPTPDEGRLLQSVQGPAETVGRHR